MNHESAQSLQLIYFKAKVESIEFKDFVTLFTLSQFVFKEIPEIRKFGIHHVHSAAAGQ